VVAAVDIGGTRVKAALVDGSYGVLAGTTAPTPPDVARDITAVVQGVVSDLLDSAPGRDADVRLVAAGVVVPGVVDDERGVARLSVNLGWRDLPVSAPVAARLGVPTVVGHDVRAGLLAETRLGAARGARHALFVAVGTGIAGALMLDGNVISADGYAGELGHLVVDPAGPPCRCGATGCLEAIASAAAVERAYAARTGRAATAEEVAAQTQAGDADARAVWEVATSALAQAIVATVTITGVDLVLLGGGLAESGDVLLAPLRADVTRRIAFQRPPRLEPAALGDRAGCLGAACLAWDAVHSREVS
jgi:glucokinase